MTSGLLVGRGPALAVLRAAVEGTRDGHGSLVLVTGEPGIGKTALVAAAGDGAAALGVPVVWGRGAEGSGVPAYWPWTQVLRGVGTLAADEQAGAGDAGGDRFRLFDRVVTALDDRSRERGLVVVLDDLQWADPDSLRLLEFVTRQLAGRRIALLGTYRDTEVGQQLRRVAGAAEVLRLEGLSAAEVAAVMTAMTGTAVTADTAGALWARTGGNPLFVRELARLSLARGTGVDPWDVAANVDSVRDVVERRVARLSEPCARLLRLAALDGPALRPVLLGPLLGDAVDLAALVDEAVAARVLVLDEAGAAQFAHDIFREVLDAGSAGAHRRAAHLALGQAMESIRAAGFVVHPAELAAHFDAAGAGELAVRYGREAAAEAMSRSAFDDAVAHLEQVVGALDAAAEPRSRLATVLELAAANRAAGRLAASAATYRDAETIARHVGDVQGRAHAAIGLHLVGIKTGPSLERDAQAALLEAAGAALGPDACPLLAHVRAALARTLLHSMSSGAMARADAIAQDAVALARGCGEPDAIVDALSALHDTRWAPGSAAARLAVLDELEAIGGADRVHVTLLRAQALLELGEPACRDDLEEACAAAERTPSPIARWLALSRRAAAALLSGRLDEAGELLHRAEQLAELTRDADAAWIADIQRWELARFAGGRGAYRRRHPRSDPPVESWPPWRALVLADRGDLQAASAAMAGFTAGQAHGPGVDAGYDLWFPSIAAEAAARCGTDELRAHLYDLLTPFAGTHVGCGAFVAYAGPVDHWLGVLAAALGRADAARAHAAAAAAQCRRLGTPLWEELAAPAPEVPPAHAFRRIGPVWSVSFDGTDALVPDTKGLHDLATLLAQPGRPIAATELAGTRSASRGDPALDRQALAAYRSRLRELDDDIDHAAAYQDPERAARARLERDALLDELRRSTGRGGRPRRLGDDTEKARKTVAARINRALRAIDDHHPTLAAHLRASLETGNACTYRPAEPILWNL